MKRVVALMLAVTLVFTLTGCIAEGENESVSNKLGSLFSGALEGVSKWVDTAFEDTSAWVSKAWGDSSVWIAEAWKDSSAWVGDIWGDASTWAGAAYDDVAESVNNWWMETFSNVTDEAEDVWAWIRENAGVLASQGVERLEVVKKTISEVGSDAEDQTKDLIRSMLRSLGIDDTDSEKVLETIRAYAEEKGISFLSALKLAIPYLLKLCADSCEQASGSIPAIAVAQYLTAIIEKMGINTDEAAQELIDQLNSALVEIC